MGATNFYALPYPDAGSTVDVPRDIKALAERLELWKNGLTVPAGDLIVGSNDGGQRVVRVDFFTAGKLASARMIAAGSTVPLHLAGYIDGVRTCFIQIKDDGQAEVSDGATTRPLPFAMMTTTRAITLSNAEGAAVQIVYKAGLFTQPPIGQVTIIGSAQYYGYLTNGWLAASGYYGMNHVERVASSVTLTVHCMAVQMLPTGEGPALAAAATMDATDDERPVVFTCHTSGCDNAEIPIESTRRVHDEVPAMCAPCGRDIEDVTFPSRKGRRNA